LFASGPADFGIGDLVVAACGPRWFEVFSTRSGGSPMRSGFVASGPARSLRMLGSLAVAVQPTRLFEVLVLSPIHCVRICQRQGAAAASSENPRHDGRGPSLLGGSLGLWPARIRAGERAYFLPPSSRSPMRPSKVPTPQHVAPAHEPEMKRPPCVPAHVLGARSVGVASTAGF